MGFENDAAFVAEADALINQYCMSEFGTPAHGDNGVYAIGYTTDGDGHHDLSFKADVNKREIIFEVDDETVAVERHSCDEAFLNTLENVRFDSYVSAVDSIADTLLDCGIKFIPYWNLAYDMLMIERATYEKGDGLALGFWVVTEYGFEPFADPFTVNLPAYPTTGNRAFVDVNNCEWVLDLIRLYNLGKPTGRLGYSGYVTYPEYEFDLDEVAKYCCRAEVSLGEQEE